MSRPSWLLLVGALAAAAAGLFWSLRDDATASGPAPAASGATVPTPPATATGPTADAAAEPDPEPDARTVLRTAPADGAFTSTDDDGVAIPDPVRDGIVVEVREANGRPCGNCPIAVRWRKGFGLYGVDRGHTEPDGTFATTIAVVPFFELLTLQHPVHGELSNGAVPIAAAADPRRVVYVLPQYAVVDVVVRDLAGVPVAGASLDVEAHPQDVGVRETGLTSAARDRPTTDAAGRARLHLPVGTCEVSAQLGETRPAQVVEFRVLPAGGTVDLLVLRAEARIEVAVEIVPPACCPQIEHHGAWAKSPLPPPSSALVLGVESKQRDYELTAVPTERAGESHFRVQVDPLPWRISVRLTGGHWAATDVPAGQRHVRFVVPPPASNEAAAQPTARVRVRVTDAAGSPVNGATIRLHETPDLVYGTEVGTTDGGRCEFARVPGGRICVSADGYRLPVVVGGPIDLTTGDHELELRMPAPGTVRGIVVDADGKPLPADVCLRRPAGAFRALRADVPEILPTTRSGDSLGTGANAAFWFENLGEGEHEVWAFPERGGMPAHRRVRAGDQVTLRPGDGCEGLLLLTVQPVDADTGARLEVNEVRVSGSLYTPRRAAQGEPFTCAVRPGPVEVRVRALDYVLFAQTLQVGATAPTVVAQLEPSPLRFVRVVDPAGAPIAGAAIAAVDADGDPIDLLDEHGNYSGPERTSRGGRAVLRGLPRRACKLIVERGEPATQQTFELPAEAGRDAIFDLAWRP